MNLLIVAGSWKRLYKLQYPEILTIAGQKLANRVTDPHELPSEPCSGSAIDPKALIQRGKLGTESTDLLEMNSAPTAFLSLPLLVVQAHDDNQVFSEVTRSAMREACKDSVAITYYEREQGGGGHLAPRENPFYVTKELGWAQERLRGEKMKNSCTSLLQIR